MIFSNDRKRLSLSVDQIRENHAIDCLEDPPLFSKIVYLLRSASLRAGLRRKESCRFFIDPALTSQRVRKNAPTLARRAGLLSFAPCGGWRFVSSKITTILITLDEHPAVKKLSKNRSCNCPRGCGE
jgi:hypothetical protein